MSALTMPLVIVNLGAEMVYILDQRLKAQCIAEDKSRLVLNDVVRTWCDNDFIAELFKPQQLYTITATRQIFERLAHASIMRLNQSRSDSSTQNKVCCRSARQSKLKTSPAQYVLRTAWRSSLT